MDRRAFLKYSSGISLSLVSSAAFSLWEIEPSERTICKHCGATNKVRPSTKHIHYCASCGVDLQSLRYDMDMMQLMLMAKKNNLHQMSEFIAFPNHDYLVGNWKPKLALKNLNF